MQTSVSFRQLMLSGDDGVTIAINMAATEFSVYSHNFITLRLSCMVIVTRAVLIPFYSKANLSDIP